MNELNTRNQSQSMFTRALSRAWRNGTQLHDPSVWLLRDPEIEEKMLRDADIRHAVGYRRHQIGGKDWVVMPSREGSPRSDVAVHVGTELVKCIKHFSQARLNLARAFFSGARFARIHGEPRVMDIGDGVERTWWVPTRLEDLDKRMYRIVPEREEDGVTLGAHWERWNIGANDWNVETKVEAVQTIRHVYADDQAALGHGSALREALGWWWYAKTHVFQESLQAVERFAQGIIHAKVDGARDATTQLPNDEVIDAWSDVLSDLRARHVLVSDKNDDIEVISGSSEGHQMLSDIRKELRNTIYTLVMGANLTTAADEGGSYALAEVQENSTEALVQFDRETLQETLTDDLLGCLWYHNWGNLVELGIEREKPLFTITQEKIQDPVQRSTVAATLNGMGVELSRDDVLEQTGFRVPEPGEEVITPAAPAPPGGDLFGGGFGAP